MLNMRKRQDDESVLRVLISLMIIFVFRAIRVIRPEKLVVSPQRILIVKTHAIGDVLFITPAIRAIKQKFPQARLSVLVGNWSRSVLEGNPHINDIISFDDAVLFRYRIFDLLRLILRIRKECFDCAFIFQPSIFIQSLIWLAAVPERIGFDDTATGGTLTRPVSWQKDETTYSPYLFLELARTVGSTCADCHLEFAVDAEDAAHAEAFLAEHQRTLSSGRKVIGICPGGGVNPRDKVFAKLWHVDNYVQLIERLSRQHDFRFIIFGSQDDSATVDRLVRYSHVVADSIVNACGLTTLRQMGALFRHCDLIVTNDSAPLHVAVALDVPTVSIFGPTNHYCLLPDDPRHRAVQSTVSCSPCYHNSPFPGCDRIVCMETITVEMVLTSIREHITYLADISHHSCI